MNKITFFLIFNLLIVMAGIAQPKIIAHRGYSAIAPENTLAAFQKAIDLGVEYLELDVHQSADGEIVVIHDKSVDRTASNNYSGKVDNLKLIDLQKIAVGYPDKFGNQFENESIPSLREALELAKGKIKVCIEIKVHGIEKAVIDLVRELEMEEEVVIFSFYYDVIEKIRAIDDNISILYLSVLGSKKTIKKAMKINAFAIGLGPKSKLNQKLLNYAHQQNTEIWRWTVNQETEMQSLIELGIDGIITNYPNKAMTLLKK